MASSLALGTGHTNHRVPAIRLLERSRRNRAPEDIRNLRSPETSRPGLVTADVAYWSRYPTEAFRLVPERMADVSWELQRVFTLERHGTVRDRERGRLSGSNL